MRVLTFLAGAAAALLIATVAWFALQGRVHIDLTRPAIVQRVLQLDRLETVMFSMEKIVTGTKDSAYLPRFLAGDRMLLIVHGEVTAGIDLGKLTDSAIVVDGHAVSIQLPGAELFATRIDNTKTQVYSRETGLFVRPDPNLETEVRRAAERQVQQAALDGGILQTAAANGKTTITRLLEGLGFESITFR